MLVLFENRGAWEKRLKIFHPAADGQESLGILKMHSAQWYAYQSNIAILQIANIYANISYVIF